MTDRRPRRDNPQRVPATMKTGCVVLMTATIQPTAYKISRRDAGIRLCDYRNALLFWGTHPDTRIRAIVFCDNSGADLAELREVARRCPRPVEFLSFTDESPPPCVHYGYGELGIIDYAFRNSSIMRALPCFLKSTGRLKFPAVSALLDSIDDGLAAVIDHRRKYSHESGCRVRARTQLMFFSTSFYGNTLLGRRTEMVGRYSHIEEYIAATLLENTRGATVLRRFPVECPPSGISGSGYNYDSISSQFKNALRAAARRVAPALWL